MTLIMQGTGHPGLGGTQLPDININPAVGATPEIAQTAQIVEISVLIPEAAQHAFKA